MMNNFDSIKELKLKDMAMLLRQVSVCSLGKEYYELPKLEDWEKYLNGTSMYLPFDGKGE